MDIQVKQHYLEEAMVLHEKSPVVDAHLDLAGEILLRWQAGERNVVKNHYLKKWRTAGIRLILSSVFVENRIIEAGRRSMREEAHGQRTAYEPEADSLSFAWQNALNQIEALKMDVKEVPEVMLIYTREDLDTALTQGKIGILIYMEGLDCIGTDLNRIDRLYELGARGASLTWSRADSLGQGCCKATEHIQIPGGLTELGKKAVRRLEELSMFLDVSHLNDDGFRDVCEISEKSFLATHSNSRSIYNNYRNLTDDQLLAISKRGGMIGLNGCMYIAGSEGGNHLEMLCRHLEYELEIVGANCLGYGFDLCDSYSRARARLLGGETPAPEDCLLNQSQIPLVTAALLQRGMYIEDAERIMGGSFIDYFRRILP